MNLDPILFQVRKPSRYLGHEINVIAKDWEKAALRLALVFPDLYEIGMSHHGLQILYHLVNRRDDLLAERAYAPDIDLEKLLRQQQLPLFSLESRRPLNQFDILGITLPYELCFTNILTILDLSGIPFRSAARNDSHPLIIGGGPGAFHPEPVAQFFDAILLGDGEEAVLEIADCVLNSKQQGETRGELLNRLSEINGMYIPAFFEPEYDESGRIKIIKPLRVGYEKVGRRILPDLEMAATPSQPLVPLVKIVHDRLGVEIARGCTRGCRFCQAGIIYRPVRERSPARIIDIAEQGIASGGFEELAMLSLSTGDYSCLDDLLPRLMDIFSKQKVSISMPSMRVGTLTPEIMAQIKRVRKTGFTLAPEAGTDRLRRVINKGITEDDLLATCRDAFNLGWKLIKLYFMFGLPTETDEDFEAIAQLAYKALNTVNRKNCQINISVATFVPKPHTPFQWEPQISSEEGFKRIDRLKALLRGKGKRINLKWHDPRQSFLEGVMSRGDRRLTKLIETAWRLGARLDAWSDHFDLNVWRQAADECGIDLAWYQRRRDPQEILPWQHLDVGLNEDFFQQELAKAMSETYTPDCRNHGCQQCGLCDFKQLKPITFADKEHRQPAVANQKNGRKPDDCFQPRPVEFDRHGIGKEKHFNYLFRYSKQGDIRFLGHLELIQVIYRALRRLRYPLHFSKGFNPKPIVSFSPALPLGTESLIEYFTVDLRAELQNIGDCIETFNSCLPAGLTITAIETETVKQAEEFETGYHFIFEKILCLERIEKFMVCKEFLVEIERKGKKRQVDIRGLVNSISVLGEGRIEMILVTKTGIVGAKPIEVLAAVFELTAEETRNIKIIKAWRRDFH